jgi:hypothetical protein
VKFTDDVSTTRLAAEDQQRRAQRDQQARLKLATFALDQPDPEAWLADLIDALGLVDRPRRDCEQPSFGTIARHNKSGQRLCGTCRVFNAAAVAERKAAAS